MEYKLVADSSCELVPSIVDALQAESAPLTIMIDNVSYPDDHTLEVPVLLAAMKESRHAAKSACPSPGVYMRLFSKAKETFAITISSKLSGSYSSAITAKNMLEAEHPEHRVHVFDSTSASAGEIAVALKLKECVEEKLDFDAIVARVTAYIHGMKSFFISENLDTLIKAGRMSRIAGYAATAMSLRPIMTAENGEIKLFEKARGSVRAFTRLVDIIGEKCPDQTGRNLVITHCNNERQARFIQAEAARRYHFSDIVVTGTRGLSTMYVNDGGVIIAF